MKNLQEIQKAITELSKNDLEVLKDWLKALDSIEQEQEYDPIEKYQKC